MTRQRTAPAYAPGPFCCPASPATYDRRMTDDTSAPASAWGRIRQHLMIDSPSVSAVAPLKAYWKTGEGAARIRWGTDGDLTRCHRLVTQEAGAEAATFDVWGFCQNLHKELFGRPNPRD